MTNESTETTKSICSVLDDFNRVFGETAKYDVDNIDSEEKAIYIRMLYTNDSGMAKITVTEGSEGPRFILYFNDIYINTCLMPDKKRALRLNAAVEKFAGDRFTFESGGAFLSIEDCFLKKAINKTIVDVLFYKNDLSGESYVNELRTDVTALTVSVKALMNACEFLELLQKAEVQKKEEKMDNKILKLKTELVKMGWKIEERTGTDGWGAGKIGYTIWITRPDWHGKEIYSLTALPEMSLHGLCDDAADEEKMLKTVKDLKTLAKKAWNEFPDSIPVQNAYGELVEEIMSKPFSEGRNITEGELR